MKIKLLTNIDSLSEFYLQTLVLLYKPCEVFGKADTSLSLLCCEAYEKDGKVICKIVIEDMGKTESAESSTDDFPRFPDTINIAKAVAGRAFCKCAERMYGFRSPFGIITGIRPAKLALSYLEKGYSKQETREVFKNIYMIEEKKAVTLTEIANKERTLLHRLPEKSFSLYISIPFCPTRCAYCSFVSYSTEKLLSLIPKYLLRLCEDIKRIAQITKVQGLRLFSVYIGGGTPTTLNEEQIRILLECVRSNFTITPDVEFTFEAGRPDTVNEEKLRILREYGVNRISINTQSTNNSVLSEVGRNHTFEDYLEKLSLAKKIGFHSINTDLIAGLPTESIDSFKRSINDVITTGVKNITVHSLTLKKSSQLKYRRELELLLDGKKVREMLDYSEDALLSNGYFPYYIYRQKNTAGNLENTGYCKNGTECVYNIVMMEEFHSVFSAGAGAVTKLVSPDRNTIERIFNQKYPYEYLAKEENILDYDKVAQFYNKHF